MAYFPASVGGGIKSASFNATTSASGNFIVDSSGTKIIVFVKFNKTDVPTSNAYVSEIFTDYLGETGVRVKNLNNQYVTSTSVSGTYYYFEE